MSVRCSIQGFSKQSMWCRPTDETLVILLFLKERRFYSFLIHCKKIKAETHNKEISHAECFTKLRQITTSNGYYVSQVHDK